ncbi:hypothetical protein OAA34_00240 [bacterium]|nr:hypothetical protein [bacterium]
MAGPIKIKAPSETLANGVQGVQELSVVEIKNYTANILTTQFASSTDVGSLQVGTSGAPANFTSVGTFTNREMNNAVGTHPVDPNDFTSTVYTFSQGTATATDSKTASPIRYNGTDLEVSSDAEIDSEIIDYCIKAMVDQDANTCGQYYLSASAPAGGTWTSRGTITDTQVDGTDVTKTLWQKTAATTVPSTTTNRTLVKSDGNSDFKEFTDAEIQALEGRFRNRIAANEIGKYVVDTSAPGTGTWQQMGETLTDQLKNTASYNYAGTYAGTYSGNYTGSYSGTYSGNYTGSYTLFYSGSVGGYFSGTYTGFYTGSYSGTYTGSYTGNYTGYYAGVTVISTSSTQESKKLFVRIA